jgi:hypothetical protein
MAVIAAIIGGIIAGLKIPLLSPVVYFLKFRRDVFLIAFFAYALALGYEFEVSNIYEANWIAVIGVVLPSLLLLDSGLRGDGIRPDQLPFAAAFVAGLFVHEVFAAAVIVALLYHFAKDYPKRGILAAITGVSVLALGLVLGESILNVTGGASTQVVFISSVSVLTALLFWRQVRGVEMSFKSDRKDQ